MQVRVRLFASLREDAGVSELWLALPAGATAEGAWRALLDRHPLLAARRGNLSVSLNGRYSSFDASLAEGDEVVFLPPVSGG